MHENADIVISAWEGENLIGLSRVIFVIAVSFQVCVSITSIAKKESVID